MGKYDVAIKIADEGGGAPRSDMDLLWTYYYTTANKFLVGANALPPVSVRNHSFPLCTGRESSLHQLYPLFVHGLCVFSRKH